MSRYLCPISTCNVYFEGSVADIIPPASGHMGGSHNMNFSDQDIITIIQRQADPNYRKENITVGTSGGSSSPSHSVTPSTSISKSKKSRKVRSNLKATPEEKKKWWEKMGKK